MSSAEANVDPIVPDRHYTAKEASALLASRGLRLSARSLLAMAQRGDAALPARRVGPNRGRVYFTGEAIAAYLRGGPAPAAPRPARAAAPRAARPNSSPRPAPAPDWRAELERAREPIRPPSRRAP